MGLWKRIKSYFAIQKPPSAAPDETEALRLNFQERYHNFKLLLGANHRALETMADMERMLEGDQPFGMSYIRSRCTAVSVNVFRMIRKIEKLAPGKYSGLMERYDAIQEEIDRIISQRPAIRDTRLVIPIQQINKEMTDLVGAKMAQLGELRNRIGLNVPDGFAITAAAYERFLAYNDLHAEIERRIPMLSIRNMEQLIALSTEIRQQIVQGTVPPELAQEIFHAAKSLSSKEQKPITLAVRSSALGEDTSGASFAGQYRSILNVNMTNLLDAYKEVISSKYNVPAITYRLNRGFRDEDVPMCVACLTMVDGVAGGVVYTQNPVDPADPSIFINSAWGLPKSVVDGSVACDLFVVTRDLEWDRQRSVIENKDQKFCCYPEEGVCRMDLTGDLAVQPSLTESQVRELAKLSLQLESHYGKPLDIEWALTDRDSCEFQILQCRPLQPSKPGLRVFPESKATDNLSELQIAGGGIAVSPGVGVGPAYLVEKAVDILGFQAGSVLIVRQALPQWAPMLDRAAAVVSEQGGVAGHLASVAREFGVPALFGVKDALKKIRPNMMVTVDADGLRILEGRVNLPSVVKKKSGYMMWGSPVHQVLQQVGRHILPLNLLDPESPDFRPANCKTLHDITRFIHEKSVQEMFRFGETHQFSEKSGKQLYYKVPMQWWILDLDDGFHREVTGRYVRIEDIASIPMLALWDGMLAIPWEGPPPMDTRGFLSVVFEATANPALNTGIKTRYAERNYFMISKHYCSLSSRLGFHFSTLETLVSERDSENYISFRFKGGAADEERRTRRVEFIGELLVEYGFDATVQSDHLEARLVGGACDFVKSRLKMLGYLIQHTRQLDMIMSKPSLVIRYRNKFRQDIDQLLSVSSNHTG